MLWMQPNANFLAIFDFKCPHPRLCPLLCVPECLCACLCVCVFAYWRNTSYHSSLFARVRQTSSKAAGQRWKRTANFRWKSARKIKICQIAACSLWTQTETENETKVICKANCDDRHGSCFAAKTSWKRDLKSSDLYSCKGKYSRIFYFKELYRTVKLTFFIGWYFLWHKISKNLIWKLAGFNNIF